MPTSKKSKKTPEAEKDVKAIKSVLEQRGWEVRRESLSRGHSFSVRSGSCRLEESKLIFVDKRLPLENQLSLLVDNLIDRNIKLSEEEREKLSTTTSQLLAA